MVIPVSDRKERSLADLSSSKESRRLWLNILKMIFTSRSYAKASISSISLFKIDLLCKTNSTHMPTIVAISDTHNQHDKVILPKGDILIHAGDYSNIGTREDTISFLDWFAAQPHATKIFIAGNHDFYAQRQPAEFRSLIPSAVHYLENESIVVRGIRIWGSPYTPYFGGMAFNQKRGKNSKAIWDLIPDDTDILVTHGPPHGILDHTYRYTHVGCEELKIKIDQIKPRYHIFGHIHEQPGVERIAETTYMNATQVNLFYQLTRKPLVFQY
jgi:Icc-related predicted phosphoesterase